MNGVRTQTLEAGTEFEARGPVVIGLEDTVRWAAASGDYTPFHFDPAAAADRGFRGPVAHGPWKSAVLRSLLDEWLGQSSTLVEFDARYLSADCVGDELTFGGVVSSVEAADDGSRRVRCDLWARRADGGQSVAATAVVVVDAQPGGGLPVDRLKAAVKLGEDAGSFVYRVDRNDILSFVDAIGGWSRADDDDTIAPTTFFAALDPVERRDLDLDAFLQRLPFPMRGGGNAFNEVDYVRPIREGDVITVTTRYTDVYEKKGSRGTLLFRVRTNELRDADGQLVATTRCGHVLTYDVPDPAATGEASA